MDIWGGLYCCFDRKQLQFNRVVLLGTVAGASNIIVYHYCFRADWKRLKGKVRLLFQLFIAFVWIILNWKDGEKVPQPAPPQLPAPDPIKQPIMPPPEKVPVTQAVSAFVPKATLQAMKLVSAPDAAMLAMQQVDIAFEPYVPE